MNRSSHYCPVCDHSQKRHDGHQYAGRRDDFGHPDSPTLSV